MQPCGGVEMSNSNRKSKVASSERSEHSHIFPPTDWTKILDAGSQLDEARQSSLNFIAERYWRPVFYYVRSRGFDPSQTADLTQSFFLMCIEKGIIAQADPSRGRFRSFLLTAIKHFLSNVVRDAHAQKRNPPQGFVPAHELGTDEGPYLVPFDNENPEVVFYRTWNSDLVLRVLKALESEYSTAGKTAHLKLFREVIINPALHGLEAPSVKELAMQLGLTEKEAHNRLLTTRRAYQRLLREEIHSFASSEEEVAVEIQDLFKFLSKA